MEGERIRSARNAKLKILREAREGGELLVAEGVRLVGDGLAAGLRPVALFVAPGLERSELGRGLLEELRGRPLHELSDEVLAKVSRLKTPQGVLAVFERPRFEDEAFFAGEGAFLLVAAGVRDPGNMGALVRVAEAAGAKGVLVCEGSADPFRDKALRGSSGSAFRLPLRAGIAPAALVAMLRARGGTLLGLDAHEGEDLFEADLGPAPRAYVLGGEGAGLPGALADQLDRKLRIPMAPSVESLNVSVAAGIVLFEELRRARVGG
ncbi:MAG TPA: RNA methyltransferase [Planctomycetes bacterium]|nr:RNA methyltransferase [Planctomycetota bacterium]